MKTKKTLRFTGYERVIFCILFAVYALYCYYIISETPYLTWFDFLPFVDKFLDGNLQLSDFFAPPSAIDFGYSDHGGYIAYKLLLIVNAVLFDLSTRFDVTVNCLVVLGIALACFYGIKSTAVEQHSKVYMLCMLLVALFCFTPMQNTSGAMETQVRMGIGFFVLTAFLSSRVLLRPVSGLVVLLTAGVSFLSIVVFGTMYSFAGAIVLCAVCLFCAIFHVERRKKALVLLGANLAGSLGFMLLFDFFGNINRKSDNIAGRLLQMFTQPLETAKAFGAYNGSSVLGYATLADGRLSSRLYLLVSLVVLLVFAFAAYCYVSSKMYRTTYVPLFLAGYSWVVFLLIAAGRHTGWPWFTSWWYYVNIKLAAIACVWAILYKCQQLRQAPAPDKKGRAVVLLCKGSALVLLATVLLGSWNQLARAGGERAYYLNMQQHFGDSPETMPVDESGLTPFQYGLEPTMASIEILQKHNLGPFKYYDSYLIAMEGQNRIVRPIATEGLWDDDWAEPYMQTSVESNETGYLSISMYYPGEITEQLTGVVKLNGEAHPFQISQENILLEYDVAPDSIVNIVIECDFEYPDMPAEDQRELSFVLSGIETTPKEAE